MSGCYYTDEEIASMEAQLADVCAERTRLRNALLVVAGIGLPPARSAVVARMREVARTALKPSGDA
jgi:hypothetical protein